MVVAVLGLLTFAIGVIVHAAAWKSGRLVLPSTGATHQVVLSSGRSALYLGPLLYALYSLAMPIGSIAVFLAWVMQAFVNNFMKQRT